MRKAIKLFFLAFILLVLSSLMLSSFVFAHGDFTEAKELINSKIACEEISDEQLEMMGDYYMEQMHQGEQHEAMDKMMGGEGSESLKQMHINMAKSLYCGENNEMMTSGMMNMMSSGMMGAGMKGCGMMGNMMNGGMMSGGMMNFGGGNMMDYSSGYNMMGSGYFGWTLWSLVYVALTAFIFGLIFWWTYKIILGGSKRK